MQLHRHKATNHCVRFLSFGGILGSQVTDNSISFMAKKTNQQIQWKEWMAALSKTRSKIFLHYGFLIVGQHFHRIIGWLDRFWHFVSVIWIFKIQLVPEDQRLCLRRSPGSSLGVGSGKDIRMCNYVKIYTFCHVRLRWNKEATLSNSSFVFYIFFTRQKYTILVITIIGTFNKMLPGVEFKKSHHEDLYTNLVVATFGHNVPDGQN